MIEWFFRAAMHSDWQLVLLYYYRAIRSPTRRRNVEWGQNSPVNMAHCSPHKTGLAWLAEAIASVRTAEAVLQQCLKAFDENPWPVSLRVYSSI